MNRREVRGSYFERKLLQDMSVASLLAQRYLSGQLTRSEPNRKSMVIHARQTQFNGAANQCTSPGKSANFSLKSSSSDLLRRLLSNKPGRIKRCIQLERGYIGE